MWLPPPNIGLLKNIARYWQHFFREIAWIWLCENFPHGIDLILSAQGLTCVCMCTMPMQASEAALIYWKSSFTRESRSQNFHPYFKTFFHWLLQNLKSRPKHLKGHSGPRMRHLYGPNICEVIRDPMWDTFSGPNICEVIFYRTQVSLGSGLCVPVSVPPSIQELCETLLMWLWLMMIPTQH